MQNETTSRAQINGNVQTLLRILIASYFIAISLGLVTGTDYAVLASQIAPAHVAQMVTAIVVFSLGFMVMIGSHTRSAALILGMMTVAAAYVAVAEAGMEAELGAFWRDLALVAALMLTYADKSPAARSQPVIRRKVQPRRVKTSGARSGRPVPETPTIAFSTRRAGMMAEAARPTAQVTDLAAARARLQRPTDLREPLANQEIDNIFLDDRMTAQLS